MAKYKVIKTNEFIAKDHVIFEAFRCCAHLTEEHMLALGYSAHRIKRLEASKFIKRDVVNDVHGNRHVAYALTREIFKVLIKQGYEDFQKAQSVKHDSAIADVYVVATEEQRKSWVTETQFQREFNDKLLEFKNNNEARYEEIKNECSPCDGGYYEYDHATERYELQLVEVVTKHYSSQMIYEKKCFSEVVGGSYNQIRV